MILPVKKPYRITSPYGWRTLQGKREFHDGLDFVSQSNQDVYAISSGVVVYDMDNYNDALRWVDNKHSGGNMVIILHDYDGAKIYCRYLHLRNNKVKVNDKITEGQLIGQYANVGRSYGAHLHFDVYSYPEWRKEDPTKYLEHLF